MSERARHPTCRCPERPARGSQCPHCGLRSWRLPTSSSATFEDALSADGPRLVAWLERRIGSPVNERFAQLMRRWRNGRRADFYSLDELLVHHAIHPSELPDDIWLSTARPRHMEHVA